MKTIPHIWVLAFLLVVAPSQSFGMMSIENVSRQRAKKLGMEIRCKAAGPEVVRVEFEFETKGELQSFSRVDLEIRDGVKLLISSTLREEKSSPGHIIVSFAAGRENLDKITLRVVVQRAPRDMTGYDVRVKDFVDLEKVR